MADGNGTCERIKTAEANREWVRGLLRRKDRQFAEMLDLAVRTEALLCAQEGARG